MHPPSQGPSNGNYTAQNNNKNVKVQVPDTLPVVHCSIIAWLQAFADRAVTGATGFLFSFANSTAAARGSSNKPPVRVPGLGKDSTEGGSRTKKEVASDRLLPASALTGKRTCQFAFSAPASPPLPTQISNPSNL
jgi:hypothetical protein